MISSTYIALWIFSNRNMHQVGRKSYLMEFWLWIHCSLNKWEWHQMEQAHQRAVGRCKPPWKQMHINFTLEVGKTQAPRRWHNQWSRLDLKQLTKRQEQCMVYLGSHQILHLNICTMREFQLYMLQQHISCTMFTLGLLGWQPLSPTFQIKERFSNIPQHINNIYCTHRITDNSNAITATITQHSPSWASKSYPEFSTTASPTTTRRAVNSWDSSLWMLSSHNPRWE